MKIRLLLFLTAFIQVFLVSANVIFISHGKVLGLTITGFLISLIWTYNVRKVVFGTFLDKLIYSSGACIGTLLGYYLSNYIILL